MTPIIAAIVVVVMLAIALVASGSKGKGQAREQISKELDACESLKSGDKSARKDCLIRMDTLLGKSMKYAGIKGVTVGEQLKNAKKMFKRDDYNAIWTAHKLRNQIIHENIDFSYNDFEDSFKTYKFAIRRLLQ